jgi:DNA-binding NarL/FixJ family response regulator
VDAARLGLGAEALDAAIEAGRAMTLDDAIAFATPAPRGELAELSNRELGVLELVAEGLSNEEIAARLFLSVRTVERHLSNVYMKLGVSGKAARAAAAVRYSRHA